MKRTGNDILLEELGFKLYLFKQAEHIVEYINEATGMEIRFNTLSKTVRLKRHWNGKDEAFECDKITLDLISAKMLELLQGR
jgi:hypothetical protein